MRGHSLGNGGATYGSWTYAVGSQDGAHMLTSNMNGDWTGSGPFDDVLAAEFCPAEPSDGTPG
ncbi:hypothetical protein [Nocardia jinanensis]|uniref:Uncharacterized protein n=1 Tax=Nocardia jinanensis TaxID=382504 RepID=A0A917VWT3_9NOCA|nr:hypothetical protein [Nocardia jinanensis]GGL25018.1 hypothetical protein GCM10011588_44840 [Nocardia jinanensis]